MRWIRICALPAFVILWLLLITTGCVGQFQDFKISNMSINVLAPSTGKVDLDTALAAATERIHETLPQAYFSGMVFSSPCPSLSSLRGKLVLIFQEQRSALFQTRTLEGVATIDTVKSSMDLSFQDQSNYYPRVLQRTFVGGDSFRKLAGIAYSHIRDLGFEDCDVTLTQMDDSWDVRCGPLDNFVQKCRFTIANGIVGDKPK